MSWGIVTENSRYTTKLGAGLGLIDETRALLELWEPGMAVPQLLQIALESGRFTTITARRLRNIIAECFAPRYLVDNAAPAVRLKRLLPHLSASELQHLLLLYTCRANLILADFIRQVYWERYSMGYPEITNEDARKFVESAIDRGYTAKRWSDAMIRRVSTYLTGCCADYGMLENGAKSSRRILPFRIAPKVVAYISYDLHFAGVGDNAVLAHEDWALFGLNRFDALDEIKRLSLKGLLITQAAGDVVKISWRRQSMEEVCDVIAEI
jgi:hypothetical protein